MRLILQLLAVLALLWPAEALAAVRIEFRSRDSDTRFPHAFVVLSGTVDATGEAVDASYGFTPIGVLTPAILTTPAVGHVKGVKAEDIARSNLHFAFAVSDEEYGRVLAVVEEWRTLPQPSYRLRGRNCLDFVAAVAFALNLDASMVKGLEWKPRGFLNTVGARNADRIAARGGQAFAAGPEPRPARAVPAGAHR